MSFDVVETDSAKHNCRYLDIDQEQQKMFLPIEGYENYPLVTLEEAVEPLRDLLPDIHRKVWVAKSRCEKPADNLTSDESASICLYSMEWTPHETCLYFVLNATLRDQNRNKLKPWFLYLKLFLTALTRLPSQSVVVFRGVKLDLVRGYPKGKKFVWWGFSSCTTSIGLLQSDSFLGKTGTRIMFTIECKNGKDIRQHSYYQREHEVLLSAATQLEVIGCLDQGNGLHTIHLRETDPPFPLIQPVILPASPTFKSYFNVCSPLPTPVEEPKNVEPPTFVDRNPLIEKRIAEQQPDPWILLSNLQITDGDIETVMQHALMKNQCTMLDLHDNQLTSSGVAKLSSALRENKTLGKLILDNNESSDDGICCLVQVLITNPGVLTILSLASNNLTDKSAQELSNLLKNNRVLIAINLSSNRFTDHGIQQLTNTIVYHNKHLEEFDIHSNRAVTDASVESFLSMLKQNFSLKQFCVYDCKLTERGKTRLRTLVTNKKNFRLRVHNLVH